MGDEEERLYLDRCDAGLFTLRQVDLVLVRLANMGNRPVADEISKLLDVRGIPVDEIRQTVEEFLSNLDESAAAERKELKGFLRVLVKRCGGTMPEEPEQQPVAPAEEPDKKEEKRKEADKKEQK